MNNGSNQLWEDKSAAQLAQVLTGIDQEIEMQNFLRDVMTEKEIIEISARLEAAKMLQAGKTYAEIVKKTKLSSRTVARVRDWLENGANGYTLALARLDELHGHTSPVSAD
jgi:TrpR-related protein YerC/YecD